DEGSVCLDGTRIDQLPWADRDALRNRTFGFIFQFYHLLPELTTLENVLLPQMIGRSLVRWVWNRRELKARARTLLDRVGLGHRLSH
ncbi:lipoprotein-releasing ABC transporter ATP-binding protein LolD, partial [Salmonella enterica]